MNVTTHHTLEAVGLTLTYDQDPIVRDLSVQVPTGKITCIVGANACGKSTLLRGLARLMKPTSGSVLLDGESIQTMSTRTVATRLGILPQGPVAPDGITVADLVAQGRSPHQQWLRRWSETDEKVIVEAMRLTGTLELANRTVDQLSGGQRQRVWIALTLAQGTDLMLLDEPTTYLDVAHQVEVLDLLVDLNREQDRTVVMVLHDLNQAALYSDHLVAMRDGRIVASGTPTEVITEELVHEVFGLTCRVVVDEVTGSPHIFPMGRHHRR